MRKGLKTKQMIVDEAAALFNQKGFVGCSMSDLMQATGLQKGGLYRHFASKEELVLAVLEHYLGKIEQRLSKALKDCNGPRACLEESIRCLGSIAHDPEVVGGCLVMNLAIEADFGNPALRERTLEAFETWRRLLMKWIVAAQDEGRLSSQHQPETLSSLIISLIEGALMLSNLYQDTRHSDYAIEHALALL